MVMGDNGAAGIADAVPGGAHPQFKKMYAIHTEMPIKSTKLQI